MKLFNKRERKSFFETYEYRILEDSDGKQYTQLRRKNSPFWFNMGRKRLKLIAKYKVPDNLISESLNSKTANERLVAFLKIVSGVENGTIKSKRGISVVEQGLTRDFMVSETI